MFAGFPSVYLLYTTSVLFDSFLLRAGKKNDSRSTKLCDCCSSPVISCLNRQSALRHCREKTKKTCKHSVYKSPFFLVVLL